MYQRCEGGRLRQCGNLIVSGRGAFAGDVREERRGELGCEEAVGEAKWKKEQIVWVGVPVEAWSVSCRMGMLGAGEEEIEDL